MYKRILIATEGSEFGGKALTHGLALAKGLNVPVVVVTVTEAWSALELARMARFGNHNPVEQYEEMVTAAGNHILARYREVAGRGLRDGARARQPPGRGHHRDRAAQGL